MNSCFRKTFALITCLAYFSTQIAFGNQRESNIWTERQSNRQKQLASLPVPNLPVMPIAPLPSDLKTPSSLAAAFNVLPFNYVNVQDVYDAGNAEQAPVLIIQDVHMNNEAQTNIAAVLKTLIDKDAIGGVGVEGAFTRFDFAPFRAFNDKKKVEEITRILLNKNALAAPSFAGITSGAAPPLFIGVDDRAHYDANVKAYLDSRPLHDKVEKQLRLDERVLQQEKARAFSAQLKRFDDARTAYHKNRIGLGPYVEILLSISPVKATGMTERFARAYRLEKSLDFARADRERKAVIEKLSSKLTAAESDELIKQSLAYRSGNIGFGKYYAMFGDLCDRKGIALSRTPAFENYIHYVKLSDGVKVDALMNELETLEEKTADERTKNAIEKDLLTRSNQLALTEKLINFSLTPKEWNSYKRYTAHSPQEDLKPFEEFYEQADIRSDAISRNLIESSDANKKPFVLVVGGFHTPQIEQQLRERKTCYAVVSPKITKIEDEIGSAYLTAFAREKKPLNEIFEGKKLFLAPDALNITNPETKREALKILKDQIKPTHTNEYGIRPPAKEMKVSVVVPVFKEFKNGNIFKLLESFTRQQGVQTNEFEIVFVVNNTPEAAKEKTDAFEDNQTLLRLKKYFDAPQNNPIPDFVTEEDRKLLRLLADEKMNVRVVDKSTFGMAKKIGAIRNIGGNQAASRFEEIGFDGFISILDADCTISENYIKRLCTISKQSNVKAVFTHMEFAPFTGGSERLFKTKHIYQAIWRMHYLKNGVLSRPPYERGAPQFAIRTSTWRELGGFLENVTSREDLEMAERLSPYETVFVSDSEVATEDRERPVDEGYNSSTRDIFIFREAERFNQNFSIGDYANRQMETGFGLFTYAFIAREYNRTVHSKKLSDKEELNALTTLLESHGLELNSKTDLRKKRVYNEITVKQNIDEFISVILHRFQEQQADLKKRIQAAYSADQAEHGSYEKELLRIAEIAKSNPSLPFEGWLTAFQTSSIALFRVLSKEQWFVDVLKKSHRTAINYPEQFSFYLEMEYPDWFATLDQAPHREALMYISVFDKFLEQERHRATEFHDYMEQVFDTKLPVLTDESDTGGILFLLRAAIVKRFPQLSENYDTRHAFWIENTLVYLFIGVMMAFGVDFKMANGIVWALFTSLHVAEFFVIRAINWMFGTKFHAPPLKNSGFALLISLTGFASGLIGIPSMMIATTIVHFLTNRNEASLSENELLLQRAQLIDLIETSAYIIDDPDYLRPNTWKKSLETKSSLDRKNKPEIKWPALKSDVKKIVGILRNRKNRSVDEIRQAILKPLGSTLYRPGQNDGQFKEFIESISDERVSVGEIVAPDQSGLQFAQRLNYGPVFVSLFNELRNRAQKMIKTNRLVDQAKLVIIANRLMESGPQQAKQEMEEYLLSSLSAEDPTGEQLIFDIKAFKKNAKFSEGGVALNIKDPALIAEMFGYGKPFIELFDNLSTELRNLADEDALDRLLNFINKTQDSELGRKNHEKLRNARERAKREIAAVRDPARDKIRWDVSKPKSKGNEDTFVDNPENAKKQPDIEKTLKDEPRPKANDDKTIQGEGSLSFNPSNSFYTKGWGPWFESFLVAAFTGALLFVAMAIGWGPAPSAGLEAAWRFLNLTSPIADVRVMYLFYLFSWLSSTIWLLLHNVTNEKVKRDELDWFLMFVGMVGLNFISTLIVADVSPDLAGLPLRTLIVSFTGVYFLAHGFGHWGWNLIVPLKRALSMSHTQTAPPLPPLYTDFESAKAGLETYKRIMKILPPKIAAYFSMDETFFKICLGVLPEASIELGHRFEALGLTEQELLNAFDLIERNEPSIVFYRDQDPNGFWFAINLISARHVIENNQDLFPVLGQNPKQQILDMAIAGKYNETRYGLLSGFVRSSVESYGIYQSAKNILLKNRRSFDEPAWNSLFSSNNKLLPTDVAMRRLALTNSKVTLTDQQIDALSNRLNFRGNVQRGYFAFSDEDVRWNEAIDDIYASIRRPSIKEILPNLTPTDVQELVQITVQPSDENVTDLTRRIRSINRHKTKELSDQELNDFSRLLLQIFPHIPTIELLFYTNSTKGLMTSKPFADSTRGLRALAEKTIAERKTNLGELFNEQNRGGLLMSVKYLFSPFISSRKYVRFAAPIIENLLVYAVIGVLMISGIDFKMANAIAWSLFVLAHAAEHYVFELTDRIENTIASSIVATAGILGAGIGAGVVVAALSMTIASTAAHAIINATMNFNTRRAAIADLRSKFSGAGWNRTRAAVLERLREDPSWKTETKIGSLLKRMEQPAQSPAPFSFNSHLKLLEAHKLILNGHPIDIAPFWYGATTQFIHQFLTNEKTAALNSNQADEQIAEALTDAIFYMQLSSIIVTVQSDLVDPKNNPDAAADAASSLLELDKLLPQIKNSSIARVVPSISEAMILTFSAGVFHEGWHRYVDNGSVYTGAGEILKKRGIVTNFDEQLTALNQANKNWPEKLKKRIKILDSMAILNHLDRLRVSVSQSTIVGQNLPDLAVLAENIGDLLKWSESGDEDARLLVAFYLLVLPEFFRPTNTTYLSSQLPIRLDSKIREYPQTLESMKQAFGPNGRLNNFPVKDNVFSYQFVLGEISQQNKRKTVQTLWDYHLGPRSTTAQESKLRKEQKKIAEGILHRTDGPAGWEQSANEIVEILKAIDRGDRVTAIQLLQGASRPVGVDQPTAGNDTPAFLHEWQAWSNDPRFGKFLRDKLGATTDLQNFRVPLTALTIGVMNIAKNNSPDLIPAEKTDSLRVYVLNGTIIEWMLLRAMWSTGFDKKTEWRVGEQDKEYYEKIAQSLNRIGASIIVKSFNEDTPVTLKDDGSLYVVSSDVNWTGSVKVIDFSELVPKIDVTDLSRIDAILRQVLSAA